jgi:hypothetical protein
MPGPIHGPGFFVDDAATLRGSSTITVIPNARAARVRNLLLLFLFVFPLTRDPERVGGGAAHLILDAALGVSRRSLRDTALENRRLWNAAEE